MALITIVAGMYMLAMGLDRRQGQNSRAFHLSMSLHEAQMHHHEYKKTLCLVLESKESIKKRLGKCLTYSTSADGLATIAHEVVMEREVNYAIRIFTVDYIN